MLLVVGFPRAAAGVVAAAFEWVSEGENRANLRVEEGIRPQERVTCDVAWGAGVTNAAAAAAASASAATVTRRKKAPTAAQDGPCSGAALELKARPREHCGHNVGLWC